MSQQTINNGDTGLVARTGINNNFTELYSTTTINTPVWQLSNIFDGIRRIPAFFRRINPATPGSPGGMLRRFTIGSSPDTHGKFDELTRFETFIDLIKDDTSLGISTRRVVQGLMVQGDVCVEQTTKVEIQDLFEDFADIGDGYGVDLLACFGNHDSNSLNSNATSIVLSKEEQREALIDPIISSVSDIVSDINNADACYYYKDYDGGDSFKVRVIALDMYDMPQDVVGSDYKYTIYNGINYAQKQLTWLAETALATVSDDWHVIIFGHESLSTSATFNTSHTAVQQLIDAFTQQGTVNLSDATVDFEYTINVDFSSQNGFNGSVIGWFYGHGHIPLVAKITINTRDYNNIELPAADQQSIGYDRQPSTGCEDMMTFITVDTEDRDIYLLRYGCPCDVEGDGLPYGDFGIDVKIEY